MASVTRIGIPTGVWNVDPIHSDTHFTVRHLGIARVRGRFAEFSGTVESDGDALHGAGTIQAASISTGFETRDRHLRSADFLDVDRFPEIGFTVVSAQPHGSDEIVIGGDLTMHGLTRPVELEVELGGTARDADGNERVGLEIEGDLLRRDFGLEWDAAEAIVGNKVKLEIDLSLVRAL